MDAIPPDIVLWVPARAASVHLLRMVAASAGAQSELSVDQIDDVRLAVTEAASHLLAGNRDRSTICMRLSTIAGGLRVRVTLVAGASGSPDRGTSRDGRVTIRSVEGSLAWQILLALGEDVRPIADAREVGVIFAKTRQPAGAP
jgi:hypothetical protein